ncbi:MAG: hypothetical protein AUJ92_03665 [Armatimonadetes bacterium CG2_30_59_28]|nr:hypothetical protein [Armatimonadota bacterium]OIO97477.1 MAG: hypothetical protein AUJ92_03665 [Armatimonadetes bacterium CG2_30_59_28]PIU62635.1 MAG: hypothetical protein COS85_17945 [Armatimonadetes bacterium CG07_land_8_20_14_0_80_59_28]PIX39357.1 MAG: hypothetical protein COZ56_17870 [Armatimonadetes bacterium CG_4_8_14_3_um_filter_58_9]
MLRSWWHDVKQKREHADGLFPKNHQTAFALFLFFLALYTLTMSGRISSPDGELVFRAAQSLATEGDWSIQPINGWAGFGSSRGKDGEFYSLFGPGESVAMVPFHALGRSCVERWPAFFEFLSRRPFFRDYYTRTNFNETVRLFAVWLNVLVTSLTCALLYRVACRLEARVEIGVCIALLFGLATPAWAYSRDGFSEPLATLLLLFSFEQLLPQSRSGNSTIRSHGSCRLLLAGLALGLSTLTHISIALAVPFFLWYVVTNTRHRKPADFSETTDRQPAHHLSPIVFALPLLACASVLLFHNYARFGNPLETGRMNRYGHFVAPWIGMLGLSVSPGKGLLLYAPIVVSCLLGFPSFRRRWPREAMLIAAMCILRFIFVAARSDWHGGVCIGPRLLMVLLPFLLILLLEDLGAWQSRRLFQVKARILCATMALSLFVQIVLIKGNVFDWSFWRRAQLITQGISDSTIYNHLFHWSWSCSPLTGFLWFPPTDMLLLDAIRYHAPLTLIFCFVLVFLLFAGCTVFLQRILQKREVED